MDCGILAVHRSGIRGKHPLQTVIGRSCKVLHLEARVSVIHALCCEYNWGMQQSTANIKGRLHMKSGYSKVHIRAVQFWSAQIKFAQHTTQGVRLAHNKT